MTTQSNRVADAITAAQTARQDRQPPPALNARACREIYHELGSRTTLRMINVLAHLFDHTPEDIAKILIQQNVRLRQRDLEILNTRATTKDQRTTSRSNTSRTRSKPGKRQTLKDQKQSKNTVTSQKKRAGKILHAPRYPDPMAQTRDKGSDSAASPSRLPGHCRRGHRLVAPNLTNPQPSRGGRSRCRACGLGHHDVNDARAAWGVILDINVQANRRYEHLMRSAAC